MRIGPIVMRYPAPGSRPGVSAAPGNGSAAAPAHHGDAERMHREHLQMQRDQMRFQRDQMRLQLVGSACQAADADSNGGAMIVQKGL